MCAAVRTYVHVRASSLCEQNKEREKIIRSTTLYTFLLNCIVLNEVSNNLKYLFLLCAGNNLTGLAVHFAMHFVHDCYTTFSTVMYAYHKVALRLENC